MLVWSSHGSTTAVQQWPVYHYQYCAMYIYSCWIRPVCAQRRRTCGLLGSKLRPRDATSVRASLVAGAAGDRVQTGSVHLPLSVWLSIVVLCQRRRRPRSNRHSDNASFHRRRSRLSRHVATVRTWNSSPPGVTLSPSLPMVKRRHKTVLFARSYSSTNTNTRTIRARSETGQPLDKKTIKYLT